MEVYTYLKSILLLNLAIVYTINLITGSDLRALCSESVLKALERTYPQVYKCEHALLIDPQKVFFFKLYESFE